MSAVMERNLHVSASVDEAGASPKEETVALMEPWWHANRRLLPMKVSYFLFFGSFSGLQPALIMYCTKVGMSLSEIGALYALLPFVQFFSKIVSGWIADKYQRHKTVFTTSIACIIVFLFSVHFMPLPNDGAARTSADLWTSRVDEAIAFECRRPTSMKNHNSSSPGVMHLTLCDRRNTSGQHFARHSVSLLCNVSCDTSTLDAFQTLVCDDADCLSNNSSYTFNEATSDDSRASTNFQVVVDDFSSTWPSNLTPADGLRNTSETSAADVVPSCVSLPIISGVSFGQKRQTMISCNLKTDKDASTSIACRAVVCQAADAVEPSGGRHDDARLQYVWIWIAYTMGWCFLGTLMSMADTIVLHMLDGRREQFGLNRLFASIGWGLMTPIAGLMIDKLNEGGAEMDKDYSAAFYLFAAFMVANLLITLPVKVRIPERSEGVFNDVLEVVGRPPVVVLMLVVFTSGVTLGLLWTFLVVFVNEVSGGQQLILGLNYAVECFFSEIPLFIVSGWFVSTVGHTYTLTLSLFCSGLKTFLYSLLYDAWYILGIALLHGFSFGLLLASMSMYINKISPPGTAATLQGIFQGIFEGLGVAAGNLLGGFAYQHLGGRATFRLFGLVTMGAAVVHFVVTRIMKRMGH